MGYLHGLLLVDTDSATVVRWFKEGSDIRSSIKILGIIVFQ